MLHPYRYAVHETGTVANVLTQEYHAGGAPHPTVSRIRMWNFGRVAFYEPVRAVAVSTQLYRVAEILWAVSLLRCFQRERRDSCCTKIVISARRDARSRDRNLRVVSLLHGIRRA